MQVTTTIAELRQLLDGARGEGRSIGLVPTMGFLHRGHMALVDAARAQCDLVVLSIFVNPTQFGPNEDLDSYPRDLEGDLETCRRHHVDVVFAPSAREMYPEPTATWVDVASLSGTLLGRDRPGHFRAVATVVTKLFNIVEPQRAFFGEKDYQQLAIVRQMVRDLSSKVEIVGIATVREADGLACSSRNARLTPADRAAAIVVPGVLRMIEGMVAQGERDVVRIVGAAIRMVEAEPRARLQSIDVCDAKTLEPLATIGRKPAVALVAARFGDVLLIDQRVVGGSMEGEAA